MQITRRGSVFGLCCLQKQCREPPGKGWLIRGGRKSSPVKTPSKVEFLTAAKHNSCEGWGTVVTTIRSRTVPLDRRLIQNLIRGHQVSDSIHSIYFSHSLRRPL